MTIQASRMRCKNLKIMKACEGSKRRSVESSAKSKFENFLNGKSKQRKK